MRGIIGGKSAASGELGEDSVVPEPFKPPLSRSQISRSQIFRIVKTQTDKLLSECPPTAEITLQTIRSAIDRVVQIFDLTQRRYPLSESDYSKLQDHFQKKYTIPHFEQVYATELSHIRTSGVLSEEEIAHAIEGKRTFKGMIHAIRKCVDTKTLESQRGRVHPDIFRQLTEDYNRKYLPYDKDRYLTELSIILARGIIPGYLFDEYLKANKHFQKKIHELLVLEHMYINARTSTPIPEEDK